MKRIPLLLVLVAICLHTNLPIAIAQKVSDSEIKKRIIEYQGLDRGPYRDIRWFCDDGSILPPRDTTCPDGGVQRARYKGDIIALGESNHIFLAQILATTSKSNFWDAANNHSRMKQYQLGNYLQKNDNGWINRKSQYYRGAYQIEDEMEWGIEFLEYLLRSEKNIQDKFFLIRQATKDIPHSTDSDESQRIRALSKLIAEEYSSFMDLRIKIHGQPDAGDVKEVEAFYEKHKDKMAAAQQKQMEDLLIDMKNFYAPVDINSLKGLLKKVPSDSDIHNNVSDFIKEFSASNSLEEKLKLSATTLLDIRVEMPEVKSRKARLALLDLSIALENIFVRSIGEWKPASITEMADKIFISGKVATGTGFLELWEWNAIKSSLKESPANNDTEAKQTYLADARRLVEWGAGMTRAFYQDVVDLYQPFETKAYGFIDDRVRSSVLLDLGTTVGYFADMIENDKSKSSYLLGIDNASHARGLNPGYAMGELEIIESTKEDMEVDKNKIYIFNRPPSDLKPVAGIATVTEGNLVSHVQLLARNLSIPNAVISDENFSKLKSFAGEKAFYAVTSAGQVIIKLENEMSDKERALFENKERKQERVEVPVDKINLEQKKVLNMREIDATSSGSLCGPKAANLGQLKKMFPDQVVEGVVIPFGIFREHMDQKMEGQEGSYWRFLNESFAKAETMRTSGRDETAIEKYLLEQLETLREEIYNITFTNAFEKDLKAQFRKAFGRSIGKVPVFLRSDTNMEDLKDFTGAGLNLTLFNVVDEDKIMSGIKKVWASPYTERSFKWRQRYLLNPENVFPSILIIPSVDVEYSGVLITKGITSNKKEDLTLAISRGAGGAVDGQAAESYLLEADGTNKLLTPAREPNYRRLPTSGGTSSNIATFDESIASRENITTIRKFAKVVEETFPKETGIEPVAAYDIEFGFADDKLWLFQIRPFVESKSDWESIAIDGTTIAVDETGSVGETNGGVPWWQWLGLLLATVVIGFFAWKMWEGRSETDA
ncbi:MAG: PEP/pyruvate-binding domain-containing protein [Saprospiraceae bacterium]